MGSLLSSRSTGTNEFDLQIAQEKNKTQKEVTVLNNQAQIQIAQIQATSHTAEWNARKEIELAGKELNTVKISCDHEEALEKIKVHKLFVETRHQIVKDLTEKGYDADDFCMVAAMATLAMKAELSEEESEYMQRILENTVAKKQSSTRSASGKKKKTSSAFTLDIPSADDQDFGAALHSLKQG